VKILFISFLSIFILVCLKAWCKPTSKRKASYEAKPRLLNKPEQELFNRIREAAPELICFSQVSMSQMFDIHEGQADRRKKMNEIGLKSIDFLLCEQHDTSIVAAIEVNGPHHKKAHQKAKDEKKRTALEEAGIPLLIYNPDHLPDPGTIANTLGPILYEHRERFQKRPN
jgi:very-short-patch-repair endonuclease